MSEKSEPTLIGDCEQCGGFTGKYRCLKCNATNPPRCDGDLGNGLHDNNKCTDMNCMLQMEKVFRSPTPPALSHTGDSVNRQRLDPYSDLKDLIVAVERIGFDRGVEHVQEQAAQLRRDYGF